MMPTRRSFLKITAVAAAATLAPRPAQGFATEGEPFPSRRPPLSKRRFISEVVEAKIQEIKKSIADPELAWLFENCFPNTLDTTVRSGEFEGKPDTFVITGDIEAMWLRDSSAQVWPYLPLARDDKKLKDLLAGVIHRQSRCILIDPYANAFNFGSTGSEWDTDQTKMRPELHERKWEIDSLCYPIRLAHGYWKATGDGSVFDIAWQNATKLVIKTFREQQRKDGSSPYSFQRQALNPTDSLPLSGAGNPTRPCGLINSAFRPSDDACIFPFLIPSNLFAVRSLRQLAEIYGTELSNPEMASECKAFADEVSEAIEKYAKARHPKHGEVYAYEVDGFGNQLFMDDANSPSLLSLPYLQCCAVDDAVYQSTRALVLSDDNPYFFRGAAGEGVGSPHTGLGEIWPLGVIMRALTSRQEKEVAACLATLKTCHAGTGFMHESFSKSDTHQFTRAWFAWANTIFGELIVDVHTRYPHLLKS
jgi:meiotically up-regulated gene 157 (Mug157) protein